MTSDPEQCTHRVPEDHPARAAWRCPECGANVLRIERTGEQGAARSFKPVRLRGTSTTVTRGSGNLSIEGREESVTPAATTPGEGKVRITVPSLVRTLVMMEPSDEQGSYTVMAYDEKGRLLATTEEPTLDDALLAMADERLWNERAKP